jgi:hypothetical protein
MSAPQYYTLTLNGAIQRLSSVLADATVGGRDDVGFQEIELQAGPANTAAVYGGGATVSSTLAGFALDPTQGTAVDRKKFGPYSGSSIRLSGIYVIGTNAELLFITAVPL